MPTMPDDIALLDGATMAHRERIDAAGGEAILYTCRDPGKETDNEDTVAIIHYGPGAAVLAVADGAGGLPAGKRASLTAISALAASLGAAMEQTTLLRTAMLNGIEAANAAVLALANGSATTMTMITIEGDFVRSYQVGDSEALVIGQRGVIRLQTTPHSPTGFAVEAGFLDERAALYHRDRHLVSNFIGSPEMRIDVGTGIKMRARDTIVVASDGLTDNLYLDEIVESVRKGPLAEAMSTLINATEKRMRREQSGQPSKPDDLSIIVFRKIMR